MKLEIVVYNIESALKAQEGGADRIELCDNPGEGGTTPSFGSIEIVRGNVSLDLFVMIRPRGGDFCYTSWEFHCMKRDVWQCQKASVDGVVFGILTPDGRIDKTRCKELIDKARPLKVTCHRAFDMTRDPFEALEDCIEVGFDRILTAGQQAQASKGAELIAELIKKATRPGGHHAGFRCQRKHGQNESCRSQEHRRYTSRQPRHDPVSWSSRT